MSVKTLTRTALFAAAAVALGGAVATVTPAAAAQLETLTSDSWKRGYTFDEGQYVRQVIVDDAQQTAGTTVRVETSDAWQPGFTKDDDGDYTRLTVVPAQSDAAAPQTAEVFNSWQPGTLKDGNSYVRFN